MSEGSEREKGREDEQIFSLGALWIIPGYERFYFISEAITGVKRANRALGPGLALLLLSSCP